MIDNDAPKPGVPADLTVIIELLQSQLDDLAAAVRAQQEQIAQQAGRISAIEQS